MNRCQIDTIQGSSFLRGEKNEEKIDIGGIRLDAVLCQPSLGDQVVQIQFLGCCKLCGDFCRFNGASAVNHWLPCQETGHDSKPDGSQALKKAAC
ncbi:hypothetical protein [Desulfocastanea catecholica]